MSSTNKPLPLRYAGRFMDDHAGQIVSDPVTAIMELVANAWDAGARNVDITWPTGDRAFEIADDGVGMTVAEFSERWPTLSYNRRASSQGKYAVFPRGVQLPPRSAFGKNGLGRHAAFYFSDSYRVITTKDGTRSTWGVHKGIDQPLHVTAVHTQDAPQEAHGTVIRSNEPRPIQLTPTQARQEIGLRFLSDPSFSVCLNGEPIRFQDLRTDHYHEELLTVGDLGQVVIRVLNTQTTDKTSRQHGIAWWVNKRLVGQCDWNDFHDWWEVDRRTKVAKRYTFIVLADGLDVAGAVLPDWCGFQTNHPAWQHVRKAVYTRIKQVLLSETQEERQAVANRVREQHRLQLDKLPLASRDIWNRFVEQVLADCPTLSERVVSDLAGILAKLELTSSKYGLIHQLGGLASHDLDNLHDILNHWTVETAKVVLDELASRLRLIQQLKLKTSDPNTREVQELQPLFEQGLWIFGPEYETIHYTSNQGMTQVLRHLLGIPDPVGSRDRPDFVVLPDSTVGLYSYPQYDDEGGEIGIAKMVILELKRPGIVIGTNAKNQAFRYANALFKQGHLGSGSKLTCFILGSALDPDDCEPRKEKGDRMKIVPLTFERVLKRAHSRTFQLYEKVKRAPFFDPEQRQAWSAFVAQDLPSQESLGLTPGAPR